MTSEQESFIQEILEAKGAGAFLDFIYNASRGDQPNRERVVELLIYLHNDNEIDIIDEFQHLRNRSDSKGDFFLTKRILEKALPHLNSPVHKVMSCVTSLIGEAGQNLCAGELIPPFTEFCKIEPSRVAKALELILSSSEQYNNLLPSVLIAGVQADMGKYVEETIILCTHDEISLRSNALFALGRIELPAASEYLASVMDCLADVAEKEYHDQVLCNLVRTVCTLCISDNSKVEKGEKILETVLPKGGDLTLNTASSVFEYELKKLPEQLLEVLLPFLIDVNPDHASTLSNIGFGITSLLKRDDPEKGIDFLERLLLRHKGKLTIDSLDHLVHSISSQNALLNTLLTRWFLSGEYVLCNAVRTIVETKYLDEPLLEIDQTEIPSDNPVLYVFVARKIIGFLFMKPISCTSLLLSLMEATENEDVLTDLGTLLFDPILLNFSGKPYDFLKEKMEHSSKPVQAEIQRAIDAIDNYLEALRSIPDIPEMHPSQEQIEAKMRQHGRLMAESFKETQKNSIMNLICSKSVLLYGNVSIMHPQDGSGKTNRMEIPMQHHEVSFEVPRQDDIDPFGLNHMLRVFKGERLVRNETDH